MTNSDFENICDHFDASWQAGNPLSIESLLADYAIADCDELLRTLLEIEFEYRIERGESPTVEEYSNRFPNRERMLVDALSVARGRMEPSSQDLGASNVSELEDGIEPTGVIPSKIGRYKLLQKIGEGGMGTVYMAEQTEPISRKVALKVVKTDTPTNEIIARFEAERQALALMEHHNIAKVLDAGVTENGRLYFVMELVNGVPITEYCNNNKLTPYERLELFVQTCRAIQHAHAKGIVHRDIKPSNLLVTLHDGKPTVKVIDFGLAKVIKDTHKLTERTLFTQHGQVVGTLAYMSPEQAEMTNLDIDTRTDVYSLGVVFYELLTGSTPITAEKIRSEAFDRILALIRELEPARPSARLSDSGDKITSISEQRKTEPRRLSLILKGDLDWIAVKALEKDRDRRYETPGALADDVQRFLNGEAIEARPPSLGYQFQKSFRKNRARYIAAGTILGLLIAGLVGTGTMWLRASSAEMIAKNKAIFAEEQRDKAESLAVSEARERERAEEATKLAEAQRKIAEHNAIKATSEAQKAERESKRARDGEASSLFQLANARWAQNRALEARQLLHAISPEYRNNFEWHYCNRHFLGSDVTICGHSGAINSVAYSPDGTQIASGSWDNTIKLWNARTGQEQVTLTGHIDPIQSMAFSPDGTQIVSGSRDMKIKLWDARTGEEQKTLKGHRSGVTSVAFSPDGTRIASGSYDNTIMLWDASSGTEEVTLTGHKATVISLAFSPDGVWIASGSYDNTIKLWDARTGEEKITLTGHTDRVTSVSFSPDGVWIASGSYDNTIKLWDVRTGEEKIVLKGHSGPVLSVAFSPDGSRIASGSFDYTIILWDAHTGAEIVTFTGHTDLSTSVTFSPDGARIASGSVDNTVKLWDARTGQRDINLGGHSEAVNDVAFSPDGTRIASGSVDKTIKLWDARTGKEQITLKGHTATVFSVTFSPDGKKIASGSRDKTIKLWDASTGDEIRTLEGHKHFVDSVSFSPDGSRIASGSRDNTVKLWDARTGQEQITFKGHAAPILSVAFSPDGTRIVSGSVDKTIKLWDARTGKELITLKGHADPILSVAFSPDGTRIASGSFDKTIKLWDACTGGERITLKGHKDLVYSVAFSPDGTRIASGSNDSTIKLWDARTGQEQITIKGHNDWVLDVAFGPDGTRIASGSADKTIKLWDAYQTGDEYIKLKGHASDITSVVLSLDGTRIAIGSRDNTIKLWDVRTGEEQSTLKGHESPISGLAFRPDGTRIYTWNEKEQLIWDTKTGLRITDEKWVESVNQTKSLDGRWQVVPSGNEVLLVDLHFKNRPEERAYRQLKARPDPWWHTKQADRAFKTEQWYAAAFHLGWLLRHNPESQEHAARFRAAWDHLDENARNTLPYGLPTLNE